MATLCSIATGNASASGTWETCSSAAENDSEAATATVPTSAGGTSDSSTFVLATGDYDAVAVKINNRSASPTGTISVVLRNSTTSTDVKTVTVNVSDLPNIQSLQGGWLVFKFGSNYTANGTDSFLIRVTTSSASMVTLYSSSGNNWSRQVRSTTTAAPASGDKLLVAGEYLSAGSSNSYTVTWDYTSGTHPTRFGAQTANATAIAVCSKGTLSAGTTASTAYVMKLGGILWLYPDATLNMGTSGTNMPSTSSFELIFDCVSNVDYGLEIRSGTTTSTWNAYGNAITNVSALLAADASASATSLTTNISTGWKNGDEIGLASTTRTRSECEKKSLTADASGTTLTISAITNAHAGTNDANGDIRAELINLTRNIKIRGISTSLQGYVNIPNNGNTSIVTLRYGEFYNMGSTTNNKRGIDVATTTGTFDMQYCSVHDGVVTGSRALSVAATSGSTITWSNNVVYNVAGNHFANTATSGTQTVSGNICILNTDSTTDIFSLADAGSTYTNNTAVGAIRYGFVWGEAATGGTFSGNVAHANSTAGFGTAATYVLDRTFSSCRAWRNNTHGFYFDSGGSPGMVFGVILSSCIVFGNATSGVQFSGGELTLSDCTISIGATLQQSTGLYINTSPREVGTIWLYNTTFNGMTTDISIVNYPFAGRIFAYNCLFQGSTEVGSPSNLTPPSFIFSAKHDQTANNHKWWGKYGSGTIDTGIFDVTPAVRLTPTSNTTGGLKFESQPITISLDSGANATVTVKVRKSTSTDPSGVNYGGNQPRLVLKKNVAAGIAADVVLATASAATGTWETLTGNIGPSGTAGTTTTDHAGLQVVVDCDYGGSGGWVNIDTAAVS